MSLNSRFIKQVPCQILCVHITVSTRYTVQMFTMDIPIVDQIAKKEILPRHVATIVQLGSNNYSTFVARRGKI